MHEPAHEYVHVYKHIHERYTNTYINMYTNMYEHVQVPYCTVHIHFKLLHVYVWILTYFITTLEKQTNSEFRGILCQFRRKFGTTEFKKFPLNSIPTKFRGQPTSHIYILALILRLPVLGPVCSGGHGVGGREIQSSLHHPLGRLQRGLGPAQHPGPGPAHQDPGSAQNHYR